MEKKVMNVLQAVDAGIVPGMIAEFSNDCNKWTERKLTSIENEPVARFVTESAPDAVRNKVARWHFVRMAEAAPQEVEPMTLQFDPKYSGMVAVFGEVCAERDRQDAKWGQQNHLPIEWMPILMEEVGEASKEVVGAYFNRQEGDLFDTQRTESMKRFRNEMIQVAAVAVQIVECFDRNFVENGKEV